MIATDIDEAGLAGTGTRVRLHDAAARRAGCRGDRHRAARDAGTVQILFNAAGVVHAGNVLEATEADWDLSFNLNARAMARTIRAFLPGMLAQGGGSIVKHRVGGRQRQGRAQPVCLCAPARPR